MGGLFNLSIENKANRVLDIIIIIIYSLAHEDRSEMQILRPQMGGEGCKTCFMSEVQEVSVNINERDAASRLEQQGWTVLRHGWPDFLCIRNGEVKAAEVKTNADRLRQRQLDNHAALRSAGVVVEIEHIKSDTVRKDNNSGYPYYASTRLTTPKLKELSQLADSEERTVSELLRILIDEALNYRRNGKARTK